MRKEANYRQNMLLKRDKSNHLISKAGKVLLLYNDFRKMFPISIKFIPVFPIFVHVCRILNIGYCSLKV